MLFETAPTFEVEKSGLIRGALIAQCIRIYTRMCNELKIQNYVRTKKSQTRKINDEPYWYSGPSTHLADKVNHNFIKTLSLLTKAPSPKQLKLDVDFPRTPKITSHTTPKNRPYVASEKAERQSARAGITRGVKEHPKRRPISPRNFLKSPARARDRA